MKLIQGLMQVFFNLLYHPFAFTYDLVAATVSLGNWRDWVFGIIPFIEGTRILELGHGPGHLQRNMLDRGLAPVAIDESTQMGLLAKRRLGSSGKLTRALAQSLPFASESFDTIISTFPTKYIFDPHTLSDARRVLRDNGRLIVLLAAWPKNPVTAWLFKVTGQSPSEAYKAIKLEINKSMSRANFKPETRMVEVKSGSLLVIVSQK